MSGRMDWRKARLRGKPTTDHRHEYDVPDRAARWLQRAEARRQERRNMTPRYAVGTSGVGEPLAGASGSQPGVSRASQRRRKANARLAANGSVAAAMGETVTGLGPNGRSP
jgi:hypothetical protein